MQADVAASSPLETFAMLTESSTTKPKLALRPRDAAQALGVSERLLWQWTHNGTIPHLRVGRVILYPLDALCAWLRQEDKPCRA
jgi:excisionase family DNA binding protein